ncbi:MAG: sigma-54-dependent Fis family transcriptional regulator [endosymbiont of Galathealinum brachiosum]|uniref:Sigma-54-dependent Fis family transcriptional regulator n=1 Tax=endosymbiont of Galathealinum brachiosum TaxID=2200906 RepID=A0A370DIE8_9GAMM|nr:MAG: sigma-54-dependent Fis family transcriptional regulator [endosymbiont of Galathealinum brachiosum]
MSQTKPQFIDILIVEDDEQLREAICDTCEMSGYSVACAEHGQAALARLKEHQFKLVISDVQMQPMDGSELLQQIKKSYPDLPVVVMTAYASIEKAVDFMRLGAADYLVKPFEVEALQEVIKKLISKEVAVKHEDELLAEDEKMRSLKLLSSKVAQSEATVLLYGESGVGKEVFAQFIHNQSKRVNEEFVAINCAAIPENMLEAVLFGYEKGAFTGAVQATPGKFELAQNGTLLLDEISEMDAALQAKLLRVLQEKEVERLGGRKTIKLNVRVLATTNRNLKDEVKNGRFREDLFYRLSVFPIHIPPLRERVADIIPIAKKLLNKQITNKSDVLTLTADAQQKLLNYSWRGNVRELDNVMQRALIFKNGNEVTAADIHLETDDYEFMGTQQKIESVQDSELVNGLKDREQQLILEALKAGNGSRKYAAERLGISPRTLRYKLARMRDSGISV